MCIVSASPTFVAFSNTATTYNATFSLHVALPITMLNPSGANLVYSTYLGGAGDDWGQGIAVDGSGNAYVTGYTNSRDFPTANALQRSEERRAGNDFVAELEPSGAPVYSTYLGGSGEDDG